MSPILLLLLSVLISLPVYPLFCTAGHAKRQGHDRDHHRGHHRCNHDDGKQPDEMHDDGCVYLLVLFVFSSNVQMDARRRARSSFRAITERSFEQSHNPS